MRAAQATSGPAPMPKWAWQGGAWLATPLPNRCQPCASPPCFSIAPRAALTRAVTNQLWDRPLPGFPALPLMGSGLQPGRPRLFLEAAAAAGAGSPCTAVASGATGGAAQFQAPRKMKTKASFAAASNLQKAAEPSHAGHPGGLPGTRQRWVDTSGFDSPELTPLESPSVSVRSERG